MHLDIHSIDFVARLKDSFAMAENWELVDETQQLDQRMRVCKLPILRCA